MGAYDRLQPGLFIMRQGDRESKWHGHGPAPEYKGETAIHAMTMPPFYIIAQLKYTGTGFTKQTSSIPSPSAPGIITTLLSSPRWAASMGGIPLTTRPIPLKPGDGQAFVDRCIATERVPL